MMTMIGFLLLLTLLFNVPVTADEKYQIEVDIPVVVTNVEEPVDLTLEEAKEIVLLQSGNIELSEVGLDKAQFFDRKQDKISDDITPSQYNPYASNYERAVMKYVAKKSTEVSLSIAELTMDVTRNSLLLGVESAYYELLKAQASLTNAENALDRAKEQLRITNQFFDAGMVAQGEVMGAEALVAGRTADLASKTAMHEKAMIALADLLSLPLNTPIRATDAFSYEPVVIDIDEAINLGLKKDVALLAAKGTYEITSTTFALADAYYTSNTNIYKEQYYAMKEAELNFEKQLKAAEKKIRDAFVNLDSTEAAYLSLTKNVLFSEENYRVVKLRYQEGMATRLELEEAEGSLSEAVDAAHSMLLTYDLVKASFAYSLFM